MASHEKMDASCKQALQNKLINNTFNMVSDSMPMHIITNTQILGQSRLDQEDNIVEVFIEMQLFAMMNVWKLVQLVFLMAPA